MPNTIDLTHSHHALTHAEATVVGRRATVTNQSSLRLLYNTFSNIMMVARMNNNSSSNRRLRNKAALHLAMYVVCLLSAYGLGFYSRTFLLEFAKALDPKMEFKPRRVGSLPERWESYSFDQIYEHYECKKQQEDKSKPIPSLATWLFLRKQYSEFVDDKQSFDDPVPPTLGYSFDETNIIPPFYAKMHPQKGRGLYASRDIKKGEVVHYWSDSDVIFPDTYAFRRYLFSLPKKMMCDVIDWAWARQISKSGSPEVICLSINIASLMNAGNAAQGDVNVGIDSTTSTSFRAIRDIEKNEELLTSFIRS